MVKQMTKQNAVLAGNLELQPDSFDKVLLSLAREPLFHHADFDSQATVHVRTALLDCYRRWRTENGVSLEFEADIQYLLSNEGVRQQLIEALFKHELPTTFQLETVLELLILASYSRHITVNQTVKRRTEDTAKRHPGFF